MDLIEAVINNDVVKVKKLLEDGANPNMVEDQARIAPLHFAAQLNCLEVVPLLVTAGADLHARTAEGYTPLDIAELHESVEMVNLLRFYMNAR